MNNSRQSRAGISLLEVLISIGILAVGLTSVLSFIPAGHSMAKTSFVTDQAAVVAANALADIATQGFLRPDSLTNVTSPVIIDPMGTTAGMVWPGSLNQAGLRQGGVFCVAGSPSPARVSQAASHAVRGSDDVAFTIPDSDAVDVTNRFVDGVRATNGNFSWVALLTNPTGGSFTAGDEVTLSIVVFHNRDASQPPPPLGNLLGWGNVTWPTGAGPLIQDRKNTEFIRTSGVCLVNPAGPAPAFRRIAVAAINGNDTGAYIELDGSQPAAGTPLYAVPDAVAVIEKTVTLEASTPYSE